MPSSARLADFFLVVIAGIYIATDPFIYWRGFVKLFPAGQHARVEDSLHATGQALRLWLTSQLIAMAAVTVLSTGAYWLIGLPSPVALGFIAGLADFIPFVGPIIGALPAILLAFRSTARRCSGPCWPSLRSSRSRAT